MGLRSAGGLLYPQYQRDLSPKVLFGGSMRLSDIDNEILFPAGGKNVCSVTVL